VTVASEEDGVASGATEVEIAPESDELELRTSGSMEELEAEI
jgi:hypothetical protein